MKILTVCHGGNVRSHCMAVHLKERGHDAVAIGHHSNSPGTMRMMGEWADKIVIMESYMKDHVPMDLHHKVHLVEVGPDFYGVGINPALRALVEEGARWMLDYIPHPL